MNTPINWLARWRSGWAAFPLPRLGPLLFTMLAFLPASTITAQLTSASEQIRILALGDSLTAGYGLPENHSFPSQLQVALRRQGFDAKVLNGGVSGDTTTGGRARLEWALMDQPHVVIVALGANDGLRGVDPAITRENLDAILESLTTRGLKVLLVGMYAPPNLGVEYGTAFNAIYPELAEKHGVGLYPFFLDGVAAKRNLNLADGIHPNREGVQIIVQGIQPYLTPMLEELVAKIRAKTS